MRLQANWSLEKKRWGTRGFKIISNQLSALDVRLVISVSIDIFLVFLFSMFFFGFLFYFFILLLRG